MTLSPKIKWTLFALAVIYVLVLPGFSYMAERAKHEVGKDTRAQVAQAVTRVFRQHGKKDFSDRDADALVDRYFAEKGSVFGANATLMIQIVNFAVLLVLMYVFLWDPMIAFLDQRRDMIRDEIASARQGNQAAQARLSEYEQKLDAARSERQSIVEAGKHEAQRERSVILAQAREQADRLAANARQELAAEVERAKAELRREIGALSVQVARGILAREVQQADHEALIEDLIKEIQAADAADLRG